MIHRSPDVSVPRLIRTAAAMLAGIGLDLLSVVGTAAMSSRTFTISASAINCRDAWSSVSTTRLPATQHRPAGQPA